MSFEFFALSAILLPQDIKIYPPPTSAYERFEKTT